MSVVQNSGSVCSPAQVLRVQQSLPVLQVQSWEHLPAQVQESERVSAPAPVSWALAAPDIC